MSNLLELNAQDEFGSQYLYVKLDKNLLSGTYDFRFNYKLKQQRLDYDDFKLVDITPSEVFSYVVQGVKITEEKLTDYTFFQGDKAHPIWSCNNVIEHFNKLMVWGSEEMPTSLFYSFP